MFSAEHDSFSRLGHCGRWPRLACYPLPPLACASGDGVNPWSAYAPADLCTRGFPTSTNLESKLSVSPLMWSANSGTSRSSSICLLLTYQGAQGARRRHFNCNTCNLRTWDRATESHSPGSQTALYSYPWRLCTPLRRNNYCCHRHLGRVGLCQIRNS